jgi:hypothetical protein
MRKALLLVATIYSASLFAAAPATETAKPGEIEKKGFLATEWCLKNDYFKDCRLDSLKTSPFALYVHGEGMIYKIDVSAFPAYELDDAIARDNVTIIGKLEGDNTIKVRVYKAPPPEGKSFFKGCL